MGANVKNILFIEDDDGVLDIYKQFFESGGEYVYSFLEDSKSALEILKEKSFDLIISDHLMEGIKGTEIVKIIRDEEGPNQFTQFIMISAHTEPIIQEMKHVPGVLFLRKPVDFSFLVGMIENLDL